MPLTFGQISDKVSELHSRIAIKENFVLHLKANYKSSDSGAAEMHVTRDDYATVPESHIDTFIIDTVDEIGVLQAELEQWESMPIPAPGEEPKPKAQVRKRRKASRGTARRHQNQSPPGDGESEEAG